MMTLTWRNKGTELFPVGDYVETIRFALGYAWFTANGHQGTNPLILYFNDAVGNYFTPGAVKTAEHTLLRICRINKGTATQPRPPSGRGSVEVINQTAISIINPADWAGNDHWCEHLYQKHALRYINTTIYGLICICRHTKATQYRRERIIHHSLSLKWRFFKPQKMFLDHCWQHFRDGKLFLKHAPNLATASWLTAT